MPLELQVSYASVHETVKLIFYMLQNIMPLYQNNHINGCENISFI